LNQKLNVNRPETIATFDGQVSNLKVIRVDSDTIALAVTGLASPSGELYNPENTKKPQSTGKVYASLFVRHWDAYVPECTNSIWYTTLRKSQGIQGMKVEPLINALKGHSVALESPVPTFGGRGDFDLSKNGLVFVAKDPKLNPANYTKTDLYYIPLKTFTESQAPSPQIVKTGNLKGYSNSPVFSPDAKSVVFTRMRSIQYESDKPRLLIVPDITDLTNVQEFYETEDGEGGWDLRPESITFSQDGSELYVTAEENGRGKLFKLPASPRYATNLPQALVNNGTVTDTKVLPDGKLFISSNSLVDNSVYSVLDPKEPSGSSTISSNSKSGKTFGLSQDQVDEFWYTGAGDYKVHAWVVKPSNFDKSKKYPLAYLIHGGVRCLHVILFLLDY
jgi:dipeptidyl aminopeptidase/acylaminoacyl peptidase